MFTSISLLVISLGLTTITYYFSYMWHYYWTFWVPILLVPIFYALSFAFMLIVLYGYTFFIPYKGGRCKPNWKYYFITSQVVFMLDQFSWARIHTKGKEKLPPKETKCLYVYNHESNFDPMVMMKALPNRKILYITKPENFKLTVAGPFIYKSGFIGIDRNDMKVSLEVFNYSNELIANNIASISVSPEGTRNKTNTDSLLPFHASVFRIARHTHAPIVITFIRNAIHIHENFPFRHTSVYFDVVDVLYYDDYKDLTTVEVSDLVRNKMLAFKERINA